MTIQQLMKQIKRDNAELKYKLSTPYKDWRQNSSDYDSLTAEEQVQLEDLNEQNR